MVTASRSAGSSSTRDIQVGGQRTVQAGLRRPRSVVSRQVGLCGHLGNLTSSSSCACRGFAMWERRSARSTRPSSCRGWKHCTRITRHSENALAVARWLETRPRGHVGQLPGSRAHPSHKLAKRYLTGGFGGVVTFGVRGGVEAGRRADRQRPDLQPAGERRRRQVADHPSGVDHALPAGPRSRLDRHYPGLVRLSVGLETSTICSRTSSRVSPRRPSETPDDGALVGAAPDDPESNATRGLCSGASGDRAGRSPRQGPAASVGAGAVRTRRRERPPRSDRRVSPRRSAAGPRAAGPRHPCA